MLGDAKVSHRPELSDLWFGPWSKKEHDGVSALFQAVRKRCDQILERVLKEVSSLGWGSPAFLGNFIA